MDMSLDEYTKATDGKTIDDAISEFKKKRLFANYERNIKNASVDYLGSLVFIEMLTDENFDALMHTVAYRLAFEIMDQKLKAELLESEG